jgi:topoisomerase IA-like protein
MLEYDGMKIHIETKILGVLPDEGGEVKVSMGDYGRYTLKFGGK